MVFPTITMPCDRVAVPFLTVLLTTLSTTIPPSPLLVMTYAYLQIIVP